MKGRITLLPGHGPESVAPEHDENEKTRERLFPIAPNLTGNGRTDRERLLEWVETLTEDERYLYDQFGFKFKALQSICARPDIIALPGEEATPEQYISFQDFLELLEEVHTDTKTIMGER
jgi:hypothetical protein